MPVHRLMLVMAVAILLIACGDQRQSGTRQEESAATVRIYLHGRILTMAGDTPEYAEAVATRDGRIVFVGAEKDALSRYPGAQRRDLAGKTLLPGFIDPHSHFMFALNMVNQVNVASPPVGPAVNIPATIDALREYLNEAQVPAGGWLVGWGYDSEALQERRHITRQDLDPYFPEHKVMLIHVSGHGAVLNSRALEFAGINATTATPPGGIINRLPGSSEPAGLLMETAYLPVFESIPQPSADELLQLMQPAQMMYASAGYTHAYEGFTHLKDLHFLQRAAEEGAIFLDISVLPGFTEAAEWMHDPQYRFGEYHRGLKLQGIKFTQDGSPQGRTAYVSTPYLTGGPGGQENWRGEPTQPKADFIDQVGSAFDAGLQVFIHANGDAAIDEAIEAVQRAGITASDDRRTVVVHSQFQRPDQLDQYVRLGMTPSYFSNHTFFWGDVHIRNIGREKARFISPIKSATDRGLVYSNHTDFNITPLDPMFVLWTAMARESRGGEIIGADQRVDAYTALQGLTTGPAWQLFEEHRKGMIAEGLLADFVILSADPVAAGVEKIRDIRVLETIKEDRTIFRAGQEQGPDCC
ncbi:MAG: amidohydrolase [Gammaproteobacteria bacterium]|nr:MAG: amidohydrolase [Gammaproteobacteria bacterium]